MNTLKQKIQNDFVLALKTKDEKSKMALSNIKSEISVFEKANKNVEANDSDVIRIITSYVKKRSESLLIYRGASREDLAMKEQSEIDVLTKYLPEEMSDGVLEEKLREILTTMPTNLPKNAIIGKTTGEFNKRYTGMADVTRVKSLLEKMVG